MSEPRPSGGPTVFVWSGYSLAERDRRWAAVRANAAAAGLDCTWVPLGNGVDARYLTQLRCSSIVIPTDSRAPLVVADRGASNEWVPEPRLTGREWAEPIARALLDAGMGGARIGVVGLRSGTVTHVHSVDGVVVHGAFEYVRQRLPNATFVDATDVVGMVRYLKSVKEIENLRRSATMADAGVAEMMAQARAGVDAAVLYARVVGRLLRLGTEYYPLGMGISRAGEAGTRVEAAPIIGRRLERGDLITSEISAVCGTQVSQQDQPILLGPVPAEWWPAIDLHREVFDLGVSLMRPGATFGELTREVERLGAKRGLQASVFLHGCGAGDDGPLLAGRAAGSAVQELPMQGGNAFVFRPRVSTSDGRVWFRWGGAVLVTGQGGERLSQRPHGLVSIA